MPSEEEQEELAERTMERRMMMTQSSVEVVFDALKSKALKQVNVKVYHDDPVIASVLASKVLTNTLAELEKRGVYVSPTAGI